MGTLYDVDTRVLKQAVRRNLNRFPSDFMFQLTKQEWKEVITNCDNLPQNVQFSPNTPFAFTEHGVAMLSSVLKSEKAVQVNIAIMRTFVMMRKHLKDYASLQLRLEEIEMAMDEKFTDVYEALSYLIKKGRDARPKDNRKSIGFKI